MIKNLLLYRVAEGWNPSLAEMNQAMESARFVPTGPTEERSMGWVPPRKIEEGPLVEAIAGHWILSLMTERRLLPPSVVNAEVAKRVKAIEQDGSRKLGKKQKKEMKEQVRHELLPTSHQKQSATVVWMDPASRFLGIGANSHAAADELISLLLKTFPGMSAQLIQTAETPTACMAAWLQDGVTPEHFTFDRDCELRTEDEMRSVVRYTRLNLDVDAVREQLTAGMRPSWLAMTFKDRVSFVLTDTLQVKKIKFLDLAFEGQADATAEAFDSDVAVSTCTLAELIPALIVGLGGEADFAGVSVNHASSEGDASSAAA